MLRASGLGRRLDEGRLHRRASPRARQLEAGEGWSEFRYELERSRRYRHHFVIVRIRCERTAEEALALAQVLRTTDAVWVEAAHVYLLLRESDRAMGDALLARLSSVLPDIVAQGVQMAAFPQDGVTSGALLAFLDSRPLPTSVASASPSGENELVEALAPRRHLDEAGLAPQQP